MASLKRKARVAGLLYVTLLTAPLRLIYIPSEMFVTGNATATATAAAVPTRPATIDQTACLCWPRRR